jgi:hypothetical protein
VPLADFSITVVKPSVSTSKEQDGIIGPEGFVDIIQLYPVACVGSGMTDVLCLVCIDE